MGFFDLFSKKEKKETLDNGLQNTKTSVFSKIAHAVAGKSKVDDDVLDDLEDVLITSDVGVNTTLDVIRNIEARVARDKYVGTSVNSTASSKKKSSPSWLPMAIRKTTKVSSYRKGVVRTSFSS